jgi:hypothetical protein
MLPHHSFHNLAILTVIDKSKNFLSNLTICFLILSVFELPISTGFIEELGMLLCQVVQFEHLLRGVRNTEGGHPAQQTPLRVSSDYFLEVIFCLLGELLPLLFCLP